MVALLVVALVAGCSVPFGAGAPQGGDGASSDAAGTATPVSVPDGQRGEGGIGVDESGVVEPGALAAAHEDSLRGPHVRAETWAMSSDGERLLRYRRVVRDDTAAMTEVRTANGTATGVLLAERDSAVSLTEYRFSSAYRGGAERTVDGETTGMPWIAAQETLVEPLPSADGDLLLALVSIPTDAVGDASDAPPDGHRVTGTTDDPQGALVAPWLSDADDATVAATVTGDGHVAAAELTYEAVYEGRPVRVTYRLEYRLD